MARAWDNWEKLVAAVLDKEELRRLAFCPSFSSTSTSADLSSRFSLDFSIHDSDVSYSENTPVSASSNNTPAKIFTFHELATVTRNFDHNALMAEGYFWKLYKGQLKDSNQVVAIKQVDKNRDFLVEVLMLNVLHHPNLVNLIGYCSDGDRRLMVYEYYPLGSLHNHLHEPVPGRKHLDWETRMKIAAGVAKGLEYLHHRANTPIILRNLKLSNIYLEEGYNPKIGNCGLAKLGPIRDKTHLGTKADVYSFGVVLLQLISGRKAIEVSENGVAEDIVKWAWPLLMDRENFVQIVDPMLEGQYAMKTFYQTLGVAAMCVQGQAENRQSMVEVATAMTYLSSLKYEGNSI